ncbi:MAG: protein kinase [Myxococcaceae bacterium]
MTTSGPQSAVPFGSYLLLKRLAVGGMAELFLAKDTRQSSRMVVLKRILPYLAEEAEFVRMFLDEARIAAALHHPSIVELYELGHLEGSTFIAMEWVDGIDLRRVATREQEKGEVLPAGIAAWIAARLCEGLYAAHSARDASGAALGIIHRDVSPQNVMLSFRGDVKLVDFGIAKATAWMGRSKPGVIKGKFLYLAPEQLTTEPLDHRTDLFALGTMLYELTTGQSPFYRTSTEAVIYAIRMEEPDPPSRLRPGFPAALSRIIMKCLTKDRERRYQSADEIRVALEDFIRLDAPTTRDDVVEYVSKLFGDENERTGIFIPSNAQTQGDLQPVGNELSTSQARAITDAKPTDPIARPPVRKATGVEIPAGTESPFKDLDEERTMPLTAEMVAAMRAKAAQAKVPEGRRETGEVSSSGEREQTALGIDDPPTGPTRNDRPKVRAGKNPWEAEVTAPLPAPARPVPNRDLVMTTELSQEAKPADSITSLPPVNDGDEGRPIDSGEFPPTAVSISGARDVKVGEVFAPLLPTMMGESEANLPAAPAPVARRPVPKPGPPVSASDSIPEISSVSVVSAGEATQGVFVDPPERRALDEPEETSEPSPPAPSTRAPPRPARKQTQQPQSVKRPIPGDPDDDVETVDQQNEFSVTGRSNSSQKVLIGIFGAAGLVVLVLLIALLWPSSDKPVEPTKKPPEVSNPTTPPPPDPNPEETGVRVQVRAVKGTMIQLDSKTIEPNETIRRQPGELVLKFTCPPRKKQRPLPGTLRAQIPDLDQLVVVEVPCR